MIRIDRTPWSYVARTAAGAPIATFGSADLAAVWAEDEAARWPGCRIERTRTTTTTETIFQQPLGTEKAA
jgi:hypothetical protein